MGSFNEFYQNIHRHRSIREYQNQPVKQEILDRITEAALRASSSGNMQAYSIIVTTDLKIRQSLLKAHFQQKMVLDAPVLMTFCADFHRMRRWLQLRNAPDNFDNFMSFMIGAIDATLAAQTAALAAESEGLGICYLGTTLASCADIAEKLDCPQGVVPVVGFTLGHPAEEPELRDRLPKSALVFSQKYQKKSDQEILTDYHARETNGWERYMANPEFKKMVEEQKLENLAQIYTQLKYTRKSHLQYSEQVLGCLQAQDFFNLEN